MEKDSNYVWLSIAIQIANRCGGIQASGGKDGGSPKCSIAVTEHHTDRIARADRDIWNSVSIEIRDGRDFGRLRT